MMMITSEEVDARTQRAVQAAVDAGRELGLEVGDPVVLQNALSIVVHLVPEPVAVRVPVVIPPGLQDAELGRRQQRGMDVVVWLVENGFPAVRPSPLVPPRPVLRDGFSMTFWEMAEGAEDHVTYGAADSSLLVELHAALDSYPGAGELPFLGVANSSLSFLLEALEATPELIAAPDLERALAEWKVLEPVVASREAFLDRFSGTHLQALHGDGPAYKVLYTTTGIRFTDFEDVAFGPIEWDLTLSARPAVERYNAEATRLHRPVADVGILKVMNAVRLLQMVASHAYVPQLPLLAAGLKPSLDIWRRMPFAGGLS